MAAGLRERWKLKPARQANGRQDGQAPGTAFPDHLKRINAALRDIAPYADHGWLETKRSERDKLVTDYQASLKHARSKSDSSGNSSGELLPDSQALEASLAAKQEELKKTMYSWVTAQPLYDQVAAKIERLENDGDERTEGFRARLNKVQKHVDQREFPAATDDIQRLATDLGVEAKAPTAAAAGEEASDARRGLHTLFLTSYNEQSTQNLVNLLKKAPKIVTLAIAPCFDDKKAKDPSADLYANVKKIIKELYDARIAAGQTGKIKVLSLTVFLSFHDKLLSDHRDETGKHEADPNNPKDNGKLLSIGGHCKLLGEFLIAKVDGAEVTNLACLERLAICPSLEDNYDKDHKDADGKATSTFDEALNQVVKILKRYKDILKFKGLEFRRSGSPGDEDSGGGSKAVKINKKKNRSVRVTTEYHGELSDAGGHQVHVTDGNLIYSDGNLDGDNIPNEYKYALAPSTDKNVARPQSLTDYLNAIATAKQKEFVLWRPADNLRVADKDRYVAVDSEGNPIDSKGNSTSEDNADVAEEGSYNVTHYTATKDPYNRRDNHTAINALELEVDGKFLGISDEDILKAISGE
jgi:hypothetical protein